MAEDWEFAARGVRSSSSFSWEVVCRVFDLGDYDALRGIENEAGYYKADQSYRLNSSYTWRSNCEVLKY